MLSYYTRHSCLWSCEPPSLTDAHSILQPIDNITDCEGVYVHRAIVGIDKIHEAEHSEFICLVPPI